MSIQTRRAPHDVRRPRNVLSLKTWRGQNGSKLAAVEHSDHTENQDKVQCWEQWLWGERNAWSIRRAQGIFGVARKLDKQDAERVLARALALLAKGGEL